MNVNDDDDDDDDDDESDGVALDLYCTGARRRHGSLSSFLDLYMDLIYINESNKSKKARTAIYGPSRAKIDVSVQVPWLWPETK
jgi:hypothetical protein